MDKIAELDSTYEHFIANLPELIPDGITIVDLQLLQTMGLLHEHEQANPSPSLTRFFHVVESKDKITLFNDQFAIWIVPEKFDNEPTTLVLIAIKSQSNYRLDMAFSMSGIYNTSRLVLRVLEKELTEIQENEDLIAYLTETY
ncbi:MAG: hypothetical protein JSR46_08600 [Verrucomicrobia bacterium]|nr:hypothetical protein [Verrucomicrobiota bacterium]